MMREFVLTGYSEGHPGTDTGVSVCKVAGRHDRRWRSLVRGAANGSMKIKT